MDLGDLRQLQDAFRQEASDLLAGLGDALLLLERDPGDMEVVNRVFRSMHTLKGSGASSGFRRLANFVHHVEEVFNRIRNRQLEATPELIDATLKACDCCASLLELGSTDSDVPLALETEVLEAIRPFLPKAEKVTGAGRGAQPVVAEELCFKVGFRPNREIFFSGTDPASLFLELTDLGEVQIACDTKVLMASEDFDPEQCYLGWDLEVTTMQSEEAVRGVFQFVEDDCEVTIERQRIAVASQAEIRSARFRAAAAQCFLALELALEQCQAGEEAHGIATGSRAARTLIAASQAEGDLRAEAEAEVLLESFAAAERGGILDGGWLEKMHSLIDGARATVASHAGRTPETAVAGQVIEMPVRGGAGGDKQTPTPAAGEPAAGLTAQSIRVDSVKLEALMRLAGELLVLRGALPAFAERMQRGEALGTPAAQKSMAKEMLEAGAKVSRVADDLQATVMSIRMMPVRHVFQRFPRLVRDLARSLDKQIELHVSGEETELDKTVIESIGDPLTHIIRNAGDHGIELKADRAKSGKPALGKINLSAYTRGSNVIIEVRDDGKGLDPAKLKRRAVEKGLLTEAAVATMDDEAAYKIILAAGFSTVDKVTDLSGRGVGMDVVRSSVEALNGVIRIESEIGKGTCFRIELPASLLVSKGILVGVSRQQVVLPMETIRHMVKVPRSTITTVTGQQIAALRGVVYPILSLAHALSFDWREETSEELAIAVIEAASGPYGLIVDRFLGEVEVVVMPLTGVLGKVPEYVGAAITGAGQTVLVVNTEKLYALQHSAGRLLSMEGQAQHRTLAKTPMNT